MTASSPDRQDLVEIFHRLDGLDRTEATTYR
jgi:hypothetical protein